MLAVYAAVRWAAERARSNNGPTLIEFFTYRAEGHSTSDDPSGYRPADEAKAWPLGDPIERLKAHLIALGEWDDERHDAMAARGRRDRSAPRKRKPRSSASCPQQGKDDIGSMFEDVYADVPWHIAEQRDEALDESRLMPTHEHDPGAQRRPQGDDARATPTSSCSARTSAFSAASSASPKACRRNSARRAASTRRSAKAASSPPRSAWRPTASSRVIEIQFADYIYPGYDQIVSEVAKMRYRTAGEWTMPMVIRTPYGGGIFGGQTHSQSPESLFTHIAGLKVVDPVDARTTPRAC